MSNVKSALTSTAIVAALLTAGVNPTAIPQQRQARGAGAPRSATAERIEKRSYLFQETNTKIEYDVFVSTKVKKGNKSPLVVALHGAGVSPDQMLSFVSDAAQAGLNIVVAPMGYTLEGWYGIQSRVARGSPASLAELSEKDVMNVLELARMGPCQRQEGIARRTNGSVESSAGCLFGSKDLSGCKMRVSGGTKLAV
jgi:hypothetical protein